MPFETSALQSPAPEGGPAARRSREEILGRYRKFRAISKAHNAGALKCLSMDAMREQAKRLGLLRGRTFVLNSEDDLSYISDLALYARPEGRTRPIDRYASSRPPFADPDEARVLDAMRAARFAIVRVERRHAEAGLIVSDLARDEEFWLVDEGMEATAPVGFSMATRVFAPDDFHMAAGVFVPVDEALILGALGRRPRMARMALDEIVESRRFAEAIYREALETGVTERVRYQELPGASASAAAG